MVTLIAAVLFPTVVLAAIEADRILPFVFGSHFAAATPIFVLFVAFSVFNILELPSDLVLQALEMVQARLYAQVFAIYNIVAAILLLPVWGLMGVAFATGSAICSGPSPGLSWRGRYGGVSLPWPAAAQDRPQLRDCRGCRVSGGRTWAVRCVGLPSGRVGYLVYLGCRPSTGSSTTTKSNWSTGSRRGQVFRV